MNSSTSPLSSISKTFTSGLSNSRSTLNTAVSSMSSNSSLYIGLLIVVIICVVIGYLLYIYIGYLLFSKFKTVIPETKVPILGNRVTKIDINTIDKTANGYRRSFTFWIYINDVNRFNGNIKHVLSFSDNKINDKETPPKNCSPCIYLDTTNNTMFVRFSDINNRSFDGDELKAVKSYYQNQGVKIDYVPLQRWVHIGIVCNANKLNTTIYAYVDGEIVSQITPDSSQAGGNRVNIDLNKSTTLIIGGSDNTTDNLIGFNGLVAKVTTYNYDINQQDIYNDYNKGPVSGFFATLGLGRYGIRNPIYKK